jgi:4-amino-4-deoxy-L-arabinose transferase-like glycosyltransferase
MKAKTFLLFLAAILLVNITGLFDGLFLGDSALYAQISKSFVLSHNWWDIYVNGQDWLDKPHFPFWVCALFMQVLGCNAFAYKLPSVLFFFLALFYTYRLSVKLYDKDIARIAVLILASSVHIIISNNDTRAEAMLLALIIGSVYHLFTLSNSFSIKHLLLGSLLCAAAIMTKGIFVLIIIFAAVFGHLLFKREFDKLLRVRWLVVLLLTIIFVLPELYGVYNQFDLHPEKVVFGKINVSGLKFFIWDSQFGRFFNTGPIKGSGDPFFFFHTLLWAFAPWAVLGYIALFASIYAICKRKPLTEYLAIFGFVVMFIVFSVSRFQLPHYTNILMPFLSILCAQFLWNAKEKTWFRKTFRVSQIVYISVYIVVLLLVVLFFRADNWLLTGTIFIAAFVALLLLWRRFQPGIFRLFYASIVCTMLFLLYMNLVFYPKLLTYQSASNAGEYVNAHYPENSVVNAFYDPLMEFSVNSEVQCLKGSFDHLKATDQRGKIIYYADQHFLDVLNDKHIRYNVIKEFEGFHITLLNKRFFYYKTRSTSLERTSLIELIPYDNYANVKM